MSAKAIRTSLTLVAMLGALLSPLACNGGSSVPESGCASIAWGGWDGTPQCQGVAASVISGADRGCNTDQDCAIVGANACSAHAVNVAAAPRFAGFPAPCNHPFAGMCAPVQRHAVCYQGCCAPAP